MTRTGEVPALPAPTRLALVRRREVAGDLYLTTRDIAALLVLLVAVTGRNIETIKELPAAHRLLEGRAVELRIVKRRRGPQCWWETVTWEIGEPERQLHTPGGLYLLAHRLTARSREFNGSPRLWSVWVNSVRAIERGVAEHRDMFGPDLNPGLRLHTWAAQHHLTADPALPPDSNEPPDTVEPTALSVDFNRLKTSAEVRRTRRVGGHLPSAVRTNTIPVLFRNYLRGDPTVAEWAEQVVGEALADAEQSALAAHQRVLDATGGSLRVVPGPGDANHLRQAGLDSDTAQHAAAGELNTAWSACLDHDTHPGTGDTCRWSFLDCFHCGNCLITRDHLPGLLGLLDALTARRGQLSEADWWARYGLVWVAIRNDVLPKFSPAELDQAGVAKPTDALLDLVEQPWEQP